MCQVAHPTSDRDTHEVGITSRTLSCAFKAVDNHPRCYGIGIGGRYSDALLVLAQDGPEHGWEDIQFRWQHSKLAILESCSWEVREVPWVLGVVSDRGRRVLGLNVLHCAHRCIYPPATKKERMDDDCDS